MTMLDEAVGADGRHRARMRIRVRALLLASVAFVFYLGFIALTFYRSHR